MGNEQAKLPIGETALVKVENHQPTELELIAQAITSFGKENAETAVAVIKELATLKRSQEEWDAKKKFYAELSAFQKECPPIKKNRSTKGVSNEGGSGWGYMYASLDNIERTIKPLLIHRGFSYTWDSETNGGIKMTIHLRHEDGFEITASAEAPIPKVLAKMNEIQIPESVRSYLKRATLSEVLGLSTTEDTDAKLPSEVLTPEQVKELTDLMKKSMPPVDEARFLKFLNITKVDELPQDKIAEFKSLCARKKRQIEKESV